MIAFGIGANSTASVADVEHALQQAGLAEATPPDVIATLSGAPFSAAVKSAGKKLGLTVQVVPRATLQTRNAGCQTQSARSIEAHGVASVAEAAALVAAGENSILTRARQVFGPVTVAVAKSREMKDTRP